MSSLLNENFIKPFQNAQNFSQIRQTLWLVVVKLLFAIYNYLYNMLRRIVVSVLKKGPIPRHFSIIMDGNRRFAKTHQMEVLKGHYVGFDKLKEVIRPISVLHSHHGQA